MPCQLLDNSLLAKCLDWVDTHGQMRLDEKDRLLLLKHFLSDTNHVHNIKNLKLLPVYEKSTGGNKGNVFFWYFVLPTWNLLFTVVWKCWEVNRTGSTDIFVCDEVQHEDLLPNNCGLLYLARDILDGESNGLALDLAKSQGIFCWVTEWNCTCGLCN